MHASFGWSLGLAAIISTAAIAQPVTTEVVAVPENSQIDSTTTTQDIKFKQDDYGRMTVPVSVAGKGPYRFLVDTGADRTSVSTAMAAQLRLKPGRAAKLHTITGTSSVQTASVPDMQLSKDRVRSFDAALLEAGNMGADGILGVDSLRSQRVVFDFKKKLISIVPSAQRVHRDEKDAIVVRGQLKRGHLIITRATVEGQQTVIVLDTGAEMTIGNEALRRKLEARRKLRNPQRIEMISVTGNKLVGDAYFIRQVEIGGMTMRNLGIFFADAQTFHTLGLQDKPAVLLGMNAIRAFDRVSIDFESKKLRVLMPEQGMLDQPKLAAR